MNKKLAVVLVVLGLLIALAVALLILRGQEDTWIKDSRGVWIEHGKPQGQPEEVISQQVLIAKAQDLFRQAVAKGGDLSKGPCLGTVENDWVADIVHSPRQAVDDDPANQCADYKNGLVHHFIELDPSGNVVLAQ